MRRLLVLLSLLSLCYCVQGNIATDIVPSGWASVPPVIDGVVSPSEWSNSTVIVLSNFDRLYVMNNRTHLFFLYRILDRNRFYKDSALFFDPNGDGFYDYTYGDSKVFVVFPLFGGLVGDGGGVYCGNSLFGVSGMNCGGSFGDIVEDCELVHNRSSTSIVSEVSIPLDRDSGNGVFFWLLYGFPSPLCYPEALQCFHSPVFAELMLADGPKDTGQVIYRGDYVGLLDYYDIKPSPAN